MILVNRALCHFAPGNYNDGRIHITLAQECKVLDQHHDARYHSEIMQQYEDYDP